MNVVSRTVNGTTVTTITDAQGNVTTTTSNNGGGRSVNNVINIGGNN